MELNDIDVSKLSDLTKNVLILYSILKPDYDSRESVRAPRIVKFPNGETGIREGCDLPDDKAYFWCREALLCLPEDSLKPYLDKINYQIVRENLKPGESEAEAVECIKDVEHKVFKIALKCRDWIQFQAEAQLAEIEQHMEQSI